MENERPNPFVKARIVGRNVETAKYLAFGNKHRKGTRRFVMSRTELMKFWQCPAKWLKSQPPEPTKSQAYGTQIDTAWFHGKNAFFIAPAKYVDSKTSEEKEWDWRSKERAALRDKALAEGKIPLKADEWAEIEKALAALHADKDIRQLRRESNCQVMIVGTYHDKNTGINVPVKTLIDLAPRNSSRYKNSLADLKTTSFARLDYWQREIFKYNYHVQAAMELDMWNAATGQERDSFLHVIQENTPPYQTAKRLLSAEFILMGWDIYVSALSLYCLCLKTNDWPDYDLGCQVLNGWTLVQPVLEPANWHYEKQCVAYSKWLSILNQIKNVENDLGIAETSDDVPV